MRIAFSRVQLGLSVVVLAAGAAGFAACSSSSSPDNPSGSSRDGGGAGVDGTVPEGGSSGGGGDDGPVTLGAVDAGAVSTEAGSCSNPTVPIIFSPMYSAFIPSAAGQTFSVPAVTADGTPATWSLSDPTQGHLQLQAFQIGSTLVPGVLITLAGLGGDAGQVTVIASEDDGGCGASALAITPNTVDDWNIGNARYNDGVALHIMMPDGGFVFPEGGAPEGGVFLPDGGFPGLDGGMMLPSTADGGSFFETTGGTACTNCHGPTATSGPYKTVSHTPEQTAGFSDLDLQNIIWNGEVPDGGYFDPSVLLSTCDGGAACTAQAKALWHSFHRWTDISTDELPAVICYLRSLTPQAQNGASNFGGFRGPPPGGP
jgi:hypothetical protein